MALQLAFDQYVHIVAQSLFNTGVDNTAASALRIPKFLAKREQVRIQRASRLATMSQEAALHQKHKGVWSMDYELTTPSSFSGTPQAPDIDVVLSTMFLKRSRSATTTILASPTPTTTGCSLGTPSAVSVGDIILIHIADNVWEARQVATKNVAAITWVCPLSSAPQDLSVEIYGGTQYSPVDVGDVPASPAFTAFNKIGTGGIQQCLIGAVPNKMDIELDANKLAMVSFAGDAKSFSSFFGESVAITGGLEEDEGINDTETTIFISAADAQKFSIYEVGRLQVICGTEQMAVTALKHVMPEDLWSLTVVRGINSTTPAAHAYTVSGEVVDPDLEVYWPTPSFGNDEEILGIVGKMKYNGGTVEFKSLKVSYDPKSAIDNSMWGTKTGVRHLYDKKREVKITVTGYLSTDTTSAIDGSTTALVNPDNVVATPANYILCQAGNEVGKVFAFIAPHVELVNDPQIDPPADGVTPVVLEFRAIRESTTDDGVEFVMAWL